MRKRYMLVLLFLLLGLMTFSLAPMTARSQDEEAIRTTTEEKSGGNATSNGSSNGKSAPAAGDQSDAKTAQPANGKTPPDTGQPNQPPATPATGQTAPGTGESPYRRPDATTGRSPLDISPNDVIIPDQPIDPDKVEVSIAFMKADIANVVAFLSMASGVPIVSDADMKGTITITSLRKVPLSLAYEVVNSALRVRGCTMVGTLKDKLIRVVPLKKAIAEKPIIRFGDDTTPLGATDSYVTQVIPVQFASATKLKDELKPLVPDDQANILAVSSANTLIITDTEGNVKRMMQIIKALDKDMSDVINVELYQCKHSTAKALTDSLEKIFPVTKNTAGQPGQQPNQGQPQGTIRTDDGLLSLRGELRLAADDRTNTIIISASKAKTKMVLGLLERLDVDTTPEVRARVFPLQFSDAKMVTEQMNKLFEQPQDASRNPFIPRGPDGQPLVSSAGYAGLKRNMIVADVRTNSVIVTASEQNMKQFETMIKSLDVPNVLSDVARTFQLKYAKAPALAQTLTQLFRGPGQRFSFFDLYNPNSGNQNSGDPIASLRNITVVAEEKSNTLLITGPPQSFTMIENIISKLDKRTVQVFIQVAIVDVTLDKDTQFGVEWNWANDPHGTNNDPTKHDIKTNYDLNALKTGLRYSVISSNLQALLRALSTRSDVNVYSTPSITTADNVQAKISIGQDVPFVTSETQTNGNDYRRTVDFKNVSISLTVTPHVNEASDLIALDVQQTINELIGHDTALNSPIIANREAKTTVMVNDAQTIVIGGIIKENREKASSSIPLLSRIPLLGEAFKSRDYKSQKSELMVFLTPHILRDEQSVEEITNVQRGKLSDSGQYGEPKK